MKIESGNGRIAHDGASPATPRSPRPPAAGAAPSPVVPPLEYASPDPSAPSPRPDRRYVTAALMLVMVLASMEMTITATAMPTIIGDLHGLEHYSWVASVYLLACTVSMPLYGRLADAFGRKRVILVAIGLFLVGSGLAAGARSMPQLVAFRALQGLGAGGIMPVVLTILGDIFTLQERAKIQGAFSAVWGTSALAGPWVGAKLVTWLDWPSVFWINFPLGLPALAVLMWKYHDTETPHSTDLDLPGVAALAAACTALLALASGLGPGGWPWPVTAALAAAAVVAGALFVRVERRAGNPILPPAVVADRMVLPSLAGSLLLGVCFLSVETYVPLYVQGGRGGDASAAGRAVTPVMFAWALSGIVAAPLMVRWGFRRMALIGTGLTMAGLAGLVVCARTEASAWPLTATLALTGLGFGPASMSYLLAAQGAVDWQRRGAVTSSVTLFRTIGGAVGIGLFGAAFNALVRADLARLTGGDLNPGALLDPATRRALPPNVLHDAGHTISAGLTWVFAGMLAAVALQLAVTLLMPRKPAAEPRLGPAAAPDAPPSDRDAAVGAVAG